MPSMPATGVCILSIDVPARTASGRSEPTDLFLSDLCRQFAAAELPVTWSLSQVPGEEFRQAIDRHSGCEVALLAEPSWAAEGGSRTLFCNILAKGLAALRSVGLTATTLTLPDARLGAYDDVLVRQRMNAVRVGEPLREPRVRPWWRRDRLAPKAIRPLRWGLWEVPVNVDLGVTGLCGAGRFIDRITRHAGVAMVAMDAATLERDVKRLPRLVDHLKRRRDEKSLVIETVATSVARQQVPRQTPARSILRPAAA